MRVDEIGSKTAPVEFKVPGAKLSAICNKHVYRLAVVVFGLLFLSGIFGPGVYASESNLGDSPVIWQSTCAMPTVSKQFSVHPVAFEPEQYEYQYRVRWVVGTGFSSEFVKLAEELATPTPTPQVQNVSDRGYIVYLLAGGLVVLMALFIVVVVKVLKKLKDLSNGR